jgi:hypothetical protein
MAVIVASVVCSIYGASSDSIAAIRVGFVDLSNLITFTSTDFLTSIDFDSNHFLLASHSLLMLWGIQLRFRMAPSGYRLCCRFMARCDIRSVFERVGFPI